MSFTQREFRNALSHFAMGVAIVTSEVDGALLGATISSFNSVSLDPPLILFSLGCSMPSFPLWSRATHFGVTVLSDRQDELSNRFARGGAEKWSGRSPRRGIHDIPFPGGGLVEFECETFARYSGGDHEIILGKVLGFHQQTASPLIFYGGRYQRLHSDEPIETPAGTDFWWFHSW
jgi:flavin reductase (DIM6/NTAB) family NADH-FMN oxidoreductase RutF